MSSTRSPGSTSRTSSWIVRPRGRGADLHVAFVGSYVPRRCGIATFTADMVASVVAADPSASCSVFAIDEPGARRTYDGTVIGTIAQGDPSSYRDAARAINASPVEIVNVQHEFGLYGIHRDGSFDDHLLPFLDEIGRPVLTTLHTVLAHPEPWMRDAVRRIVGASTETIVMVEAAARLLRNAYDIPKPVHVIPHGMPAVGSFGLPRSKQELGLAGRTLVCTFGLVDPRKGLEYAIGAMPAVVARHPDVLYLVIGQTHPELVRRDGERYRDMLRSLVDRLGLRRHVVFVDRYLSQREIVDHLAAADVYVTPYLDPDQVTSGTLAYAIGAGKAVVSTPYLHAREALAGGRGMLVAFRSAAEIAAAVNALLEDDVMRQRLGRASAAYSSGTAWPVIGARVLQLMRTVLARGAGGIRAA